jgi:hypothetical protein
VRRTRFTFTSVRARTESYGATGVAPSRCLWTLRRYVRRYPAIGHARAGRTPEGGVKPSAIRRVQAVGSTSNGLKLSKLGSTGGSGTRKARSRVGWLITCERHPVLTSLLKPRRAGRRLQDSPGSRLSYREPCRCAARTPLVLTSVHAFIWPFSRAAGRPCSGHALYAPQTPVNHIDGARFEDSRSALSACPATPLRRGP